MVLQSVYELSNLFVKVIKSYRLWSAKKHRSECDWKMSQSLLQIVDQSMAPRLRDPLQGSFFSSLGRGHGAFLIRKLSGAKSEFGTCTLKR